MFLFTDFVRGEVLYKDACCLLKDEGVNKVVKLVTNNGAFYVHTDVHAVKMRNGYLRVYSFDSFINHSCEPNSTAVDEPAAFSSSSSSGHNSGDGGGDSCCNNDNRIYADEDSIFTTIATRNIRCGEEITTDYDTFIYHYEGIPRCQCQSKCCRGQSFGFRSVTSESALVALLPKVHPDVRSAWLQENTPRVRYCSQTLPPELSCCPQWSPSSASLSEDDEVERAGFDIIATKCFKTGEVICACPLIAVDPSLTEIIFFAIENPWIRIKHSTNIFAPLNGADLPVMKVNISSKNVEAVPQCKQHPNMRYFSLLDALESASLEFERKRRGAKCSCRPSISDNDSHSGDITSNCAWRQLLLGLSGQTEGVSSNDDDGEVEPKVVMQEYDQQEEQATEEDIQHQHLHQPLYEHCHQAVLVATTDIQAGDAVHMIEHC